MYGEVRPSGPVTCPICSRDQHNTQHRLCLRIAGDSLTSPTADRLANKNVTRDLTIRSRRFVYATNRGPVRKTKSHVTEPRSGAGTRAPENTRVTAGDVKSLEILNTNYTRGKLWHSLEDVAGSVVELDDGRCTAHA